MNKIIRNNYLMKNSQNIHFITTDQMREVDRAMIEDYGISLMQMMENAGRNLGRLAQQRFLEVRPKDPIIILAGSGGNGGGSLVCARYLQNWGFPVQVFLTKPAADFKGIPQHQLAILIKLGIPVHAWSKGDTPVAPALIIDGVIGYSLTGKPSGSAVKMIEWANIQNAPILSLDVPSGLDATFGFVTEPVISATATMTLALPKTGLAEQNARAYIGELYLADIGVPPQLYKSPSLNLDVGYLFNKESIIRLS